MIRSRVYDEKIQLAHATLDKCIGTNGVWADPTRYAFQCWTRDFVLAIMPLLLAMGKFDIVRRHLDNLGSRQRPNGQIPILFLDKHLPFIISRLKRSWRDKELSFMLGRYLQRELWNLTPGTRDSEILYIIGVLEYLSCTNDEAFRERHQQRIYEAMIYVESELMRGSYLMVGADWRDTMHLELGNKTLLTNNALLYRAFHLMKEFGAAASVQRAIETRLMVDGSYIDYPGSERFDPLGGAFAVLFGDAPREHYPKLIESFRSVDTPYGVTIKCRHNPLDEAERRMIDETDGVVVWPFVVGFTVLALKKMDEHGLAEAQFEKLLRHDGFREYYDPRTGIGYGAGLQLWSAALFLRAATAPAPKW